MTKQEIVKELRTILKTYHYESNEQHISKDVVTSLENIIISLTSWNAYTAYSVSRTIIGYYGSIMSQPLHAQVVRPDHLINRGTNPRLNFLRPKKVDSF